MFNLRKKTIEIHSKERPINKWEVWFQTPKGIVSTIDEAINVCESIDFDPETCIRPVPVAIDEEGNYEVITLIG